MAHASVVAFDPPSGSVLERAPQLVRITFSERVAPFDRGIDVLAPSGGHVAGGAIAGGSTLVVLIGRPQDLAPGTYRVSWRVVADDTHPSRGSYTFSIGHPSATASGDAANGDLGSVAPVGLLLQALARFLHFAGFALAFGVLAFQLLVLRTNEPPPRLRRLVLAGIAALLLAAPLSLAAQVTSLSGFDPRSISDMLGSAFGRILALQVAAPLALWASLGAVREASNRGRWSVLALGAALAYVDGLGGHTIAGVPAPAAYLVTALHVGTMALWVGGLAALVATLPETRPLVGRFGRLAAISVAVLVASGAVLALSHLRGPGDLAFTGYGLTLAVKLVAAGAALGATWLGVRRARSAVPEAIALVGVLALAALLASLPPPR